MGKYSSGKHAYVIDDRTGWKIRYKDARTEWTGMRVHKDHWEPKHPQLTPPRIAADNQGLRDARPDNDSDGDSNANFNQFGRVGVSVYSKVGSVAVAVTKGLTTNVGTMSVGTITLGITTDLFPTGVSATASSGTVTNTASLTASGTSSTMSVGAELGVAGVDVTHFASTAQVGTVAISLPGYGMGTFSSDTWGN